MFCQLCKATIFLTLTGFKYKLVPLRADIYKEEREMGYLKLRTGVAIPDRTKFYKISDHLKTFVLSGMVSPALNFRTAM